MRMKSFKQKVLRQNQQPHIYMQKTQGPKSSSSSPSLEQRYKSNTLLNKQNYQPNLPKSQRNNIPLQNSFGAAKLMMRQSVDDLRSHLVSHPSQQNQQRNFLNFSKKTNPKFNFLSKSNNFDNCRTQRNEKAFMKKHLKTQQYQENEDICPVIQDCEFIKSQYESSDDSCQEEKLNYAKCYQRPKGHTGNVLIHQSLNYDNQRPVTFGMGQNKNLNNYKYFRQQEKKLKNQIVNNIISSTKAQMLRSWDYAIQSNIKCLHHKNKKAKYKLNAKLTSDEQESYYCSKCAVNLAKQGFDIQQISFSNHTLIHSQEQRKNLYNSVQIQQQKAKRQEQLKDFQHRMGTLEQKIEKKLKIFNQKSEEMTKIDKRIQLTINNYDQLIKILKQMRDGQIEKQQRQKKQKSLDINLKKHELSTILDSIKNTSFEITNQKNKLMALKNKEFNFMFDSYLKKISSYEEYLTNLQQNQLATEIANFDSNLDAQQLDQETLIQNIFDEMYQRLTNQKIEAIKNTKSNFGQKHLNKTTLHTQIQSGGSSMFYCEEDQEEQENRNAFRILFKDSKNQDTLDNIHKLRKTQQSSKNIRYFKQSAYPTFNMMQHQ